MKHYQPQAEWQKQNWKSIKILLAILILVLSIITAMLWNDGILFLTSETDRIDAVVEKVAYTPERHNQLYRTVHYTYIFNASHYSGMEKISFTNFFCNEGDTIEIEVLRRKPRVSRIIRH